MANYMWFGFIVASFFSVSLLLVLVVGSDLGKELVVKHCTKYGQYINEEINMKCEVVK